jgi:hypothetical protein
MRRPCWTLGIFGWAVVAALALASGANAQCFAAEASAGISAFNGSILSGHFGQITKSDCINSRTMILRSTTLDNGQQVASHDKVEGDPDLGAWLSYNRTFSTCSGIWNSTSKFGTTFLGITEWLDSDLSSLVGAYCLPPPGGGGGGGGPGCAVVPGETTTSVMTAGGITPRAADESGLGLSRMFKRPDGRYLSPEWAVISSDTGEPRVEFASSDAFVAQVEASLDRYYQPRGTSTTVLVVEAGEHPHNRRFMPKPDVAPLDLPVDWRGRSGAQELWFRAEVAKAGGVDQMLILDSSEPQGNSAIRSALTDHLALQYVDARRHRTVVFGRATVSPAGRLTLQDTVVVVPQCCCGVDEDGLPHCV